MLVVLAGVGGSVGCSPDGPLFLVVDAEVTFWNRSQFRLEELKLHLGGHLDAENLLAVPLPIDGTVVRRLDEQMYITVVRERVAGGPQVALTSAELLPLGEGFFTVMIFDDGFREVFDAPFPEDGGFDVDGGPGDGGP